MEFKNPVDVAYAYVELMRSLDVKVKLVREAIYHIVEVASRADPVFPGSSNTGLRLGNEVLAEMLKLLAGDVANMQTETSNYQFKIPGERKYD